MHKPRILVVTILLVLSLAMFGTRSLLAIPSPAAFPASDSKKDCPKSADGKTSQDCEKLDPNRMSTNMKAEKKSSSSATGSGTLHTFGKVADKKAADKTSDSNAASSKSSGKASKTDADQLSSESMSTRGLKPTSKDADKNKSTKSDAKSSSSPDSNNPK